MYVFNEQKPLPSGIAGIEHATLAGSTHGLKGLSVWQQSVLPGAATPPHRHDCEEVVLCSAGEGELHIAGITESFRAGQTVVIPANADHQIFSVGMTPLKFVAIFSTSPVHALFPDGEEIGLPWAS
jgi:mannose-6-phosphate isomerase-like protein (cupin superfamily)